jgi:uncharacterized protein with HEPN domain
VEGITFEQFLNDIKTQSAVQHQILILGEAVKLKSVTKHFKSIHVTRPSPKFPNPFPLTGLLCQKPS